MSMHDTSRDDESDDERGLLHDERDWRPRSKTDAGKASWLVAGLFFVFGILLGIIGTMEWKKHAGDGVCEKGAGVGPFEADTKVMFELNETYERKMGKLSDELWEGLMPMGHGFIQVDDRDRAIPHTDAPGDLSQTKVVTVFHQLHCLNSLRQALNTAVDDPNNFIYQIVQLSSHWAYCFDYLRQGLMCNADTTLESLVQREGSLSKEVFGWGTEHVCKDWEKVFGWAEGHRVGEGLGIER